MTVMQEWTRYRKSFEQLRPAEGASKLEKPVLDFQKKIYSAAETTLKGLDKALLKRDLKSFQKYESDLSKLALDARSAQKSVRTEVLKVSSAGRADAVDVKVGALVGQLQDLKATVADLRKDLANPGPQPSAELIPPKVLERIRTSTVTRNADAVRFGGDAKFGLSLASGAKLGDAARPQQAFSGAYKAYLAALKSVDALKTAKGTSDQFGTALNQIFDKLLDSLNGMSMACTEWQMAQARELNGQQPPVKPDTKPLFVAVEKLSNVVADENQRMIGNRDAVKKLFPRHIS